jgi:hypothetical protein
MDPDLNINIKIRCWLLYGPGFAVVVFPTVSHYFQYQPLNLGRTVQIISTVKWSELLIQIGSKCSSFY